MRWSCYCYPWRDRRRRSNAGCGCEQAGDYATFKYPPPSQRHRKMPCPSIIGAEGLSGRATAIFALANRPCDRDNGDEAQDECCANRLHPWTHSTGSSLPRSSCATATVRTCTYSDPAFVQLALCGGRQSLHAELHERDHASIRPSPQTGWDDNFSIDKAIKRDV